MADPRGTVTRVEPGWPQVEDLPVAEAVHVARSAALRIRENFALSILYNIVAVPVAVAGLATPLLVALANPVVALVLVGLLLAATVGIILAVRRFMKDVGSIFAPPSTKPPAD